MAETVIENFNTLIIGAGAAGLFCGAQVASSGKSVCVLDHSKKPAEKVRISGGGRCNFTNMGTRPQNFLSQNPHFAKSALARYTPWDFCNLMTEYSLSWTEKTLGQLFCDQKAGAIIDMLLSELKKPGGELRLETAITDITADASGFKIQTHTGLIHCHHLVIATGGLSIPKMGATGFAYEIAHQFGHEVVTPTPALVPLTFSGALKDDFASISGVATDAIVTAQGTSFAEAMLFTHRGLSGPAVLQASSYWAEGKEVAINLFPVSHPAQILMEIRAQTPKRTLAAALCDHLPKRLVEMLGQRLDLPLASQMANLGNTALEGLAATLSNWTFTPTGTEGWRTAEVTAGGVATNGLSSQTMESHKQAGLYFIGECVDVTGWLGGYNFQWAWASGAAAGRHIASLSLDQKEA
jgi:predicted Rossmann fold flavoprotein